MHFDCLCLFISHFLGAKREELNPLTPKGRILSGFFSYDSPSLKMISVKYFGLKVCRRGENGDRTCSIGMQGLGVRAPLLTFDFV